MTMPEADPSPVLPLWRGRRGLIATACLGALAVGAGFGLMKFSEHFGSAPACRGYAQVHGWQYQSIDSYTSNAPHRSGTICRFKNASGGHEDVRLIDVSMVTYLWVSFAATPEITMPGFLLLFAVLRTRLSTSGATGKPEGPRPPDG